MMNVFKVDGSHNFFMFDENRGGSNYVYFMRHGPYLVVLPLGI